jgi:hypothetical protein
VAIYRRSAIEKIGKKVISGRGLKIESERWTRFSHQMDSPEILLVYAVTLGGELDKRIMSIHKESLSRAFILDTAGSEMVEQIADHMEADLWERLDLKEYRRTARFSPGYCDWRLEGQQGLCTFLHADTIGIHCTKTWSMLPSKSITAVILGARAMPFLTPCPLCNQTVCPHRRVDRLDDMAS